MDQKIEKALELIKTVATAAGCRVHMEPKSNIALIIALIRDGKIADAFTPTETGWKTKQGFKLKDNDRQIAVALSFSGVEDLGDEIFNDIIKTRLQNAMTTLHQGINDGPNN